MTFDFLLKGAQVYLPTGPARCDVGINGCKIAFIGDAAGNPAEEVVQLDGLALIPGLIDTQVHFREPGMEHKEDLESGTRAALMGGVTSILEMPNTNPTTTSLDALQDKLLRASGRAWCHYGFFVGGTTENVEELQALEIADGTPGIKLFMGSSTGTLLVPDDETLRQVLLSGYKRFSVHAEDHFRLESLKAAHAGESLRPHDHPHLRDAETAVLATRRILALSHETERPVHILHVSTANELPIIADAKQSGCNNTAEITPQHLWFAAPECYDHLGTWAQMNPPLRDVSHRAALRKAFQDGLFDIIGSDHAPHTIEEKSLPYPKSPSGMPGVQTILPVMTTLAKREGIGDLATIVRMLTERPAELFGVQGKGKIEVGMDADLVAVDFQAERLVEKSMLESKCGWSPYEGESLLGWPIHVWVNGDWAVREGERVAKPSGKMLRFAR